MNDSAVSNEYIMKVLSKVCSGIFLKKRTTTQAGIIIIRNKDTPHLMS